jgi:Tfp pilus assembly PilM family ATPase
VDGASSSATTSAAADPVPEVDSMPSVLSWLGRATPPIGIELGSSVMRLVQLDSTRSDGVRHAVAVRCDADGRFDVAAIRRACRGFAGADVVVSPPRSSLMVRPARLPMLAGEELREAARWEAAGQLEIDGADVVAEPIVVGRTAEEDGRLEMLLVAGAASRIEAALSPILEAGLRPIAVEPAFLGAGRAHALRSRRDSEREVVRVVVDVSDEDSWITVMRGDGVVFAKQVAIGGATFDREIGRDLGIDPTEAARTRRDAAAGRSDGLVLGAIGDAVRRASSALAEETSMAVRYATVAGRLSRPVAMHLSGEAGSTPGLDEVIGRAMVGTTVERDRVLEDRLVAIERLVGESGTPGAWATALGLALRPPVAREEAA